MEVLKIPFVIEFQHTAARRRLGDLNDQSFTYVVLFQHTAARRRLGRRARDYRRRADVSTHSRPKAAGRRQRRGSCFQLGFNTQPPEGGWGFDSIIRLRACVSTHSRPKAAGIDK